MQRGLAVLVVMAGAAVAWAGWSDNTVRDTFSAPFDRTVSLHKGSGGVEKVIGLVTVYLIAKVAGGALGSLGAGAAGGAAGGAAVPPVEPVPVSGQPLPPIATPGAV